MKGSAKIELRDAKSGRLVKQVEKHNIVTNGALNVMKLRLAYNMPLMDSSRSFPLLAEYFGGILLFGASIDEDVNNIIPSAAVRASYIGHASCYRTITGDSLMGTYVAGESSIGTHNATLVFSFDTSQANGNINCICLTSALGGIFGYGITATSENIDESFVICNDDDVSHVRFKLRTYDYPTKFKDDKSYNYDAENRMWVSDFSVVKNLGLNLSIKDTNDVDYLKGIRADEMTSIPVTYETLATYSRAWSLDTDRVVCYTKNTRTDGRNIVEFEVIEAGETTSSKITLDYTDMAADLNQKSGGYYGKDEYTYLFRADDTDWALFKDYAITVKDGFGEHGEHKGSYLCIANISKGTYVVRQVDDGWGFINILGTIYIQMAKESTANTPLYYRVNLDTAEVADIPEFYLNRQSTKCIHTTLDPDMPPIVNVDIYSGYLAPYLATINNVDTLEKNASRTLKITYNLEY